MKVDVNSKLNIEKLELAVEEFIQSPTLDGGEEYFLVMSSDTATRLIHDYGEKYGAVFNPEGVLIYYMDLHVAYNNELGFGEIYIK